MKRISVVTGNSNSGSACIQELLTRYKSTFQKIKAGFRSDEKANHLRNSSYFDQGVVEIISGVDANKKETLFPVFNDTDYALIVTPLDYTAGTHNDGALTCNMINAAFECGVKHIVVVASWTVKDPVRLPVLSSRFLPTEARLKELGESNGVKWTVLRGGYFFDNVFHSLHNDKLQVPTGFALAGVSVKDIGRSAAAVFASEDTTKHHGKCYEMNGPAILTGDEMAAILSEKLGRKIECVHQTPTPELLEKLPPIAKELYAYISTEKEGACPYLTDVKDLTGQWTTFSDWVGDNVSAFQPKH